MKRIFPSGWNLEKSLEYFFVGEPSLLWPFQNDTSGQMVLGYIRKQNEYDMGRKPEKQTTPLRSLCFYSCIWVLALSSCSEFTQFWTETFKTNKLFIPPKHILIMVFVNQFKKKKARVCIEHYYNFSLFLGILYAYPIKYNYT